MRFVLLIVLFSLTSVAVIGAYAPSHHAYVLLVDSEVLAYQANEQMLIHAFDLRIVNRTNGSQINAWFEDYEAHPITHPRGNTILYRGELIVPETAYRAFVRRAATDSLPRVGPTSEQDWEPIAPGTSIEAYEIWPFGNITGLTVFFTWNKTFPEPMNERWAQLHVADLEGAVRLSDRIAWSVPALESSELLIGSSVPTFGYYDARVRSLGTYPGPAATLEHSPSRWTLIDQDEYLRSAIWALILFTIAISAPLAAILVPKRKVWIGALAIIPSGIALIIASLLFSNTGLLGNLYGVSVVLALLGSFVAWALSGVATIALIAVRYRRH